ncbi:virulence protein [Proteiniclasticum ruminis]|uniref:virulence protein n=1 Tax=Proteiniclasticum ruminis TaxID=398199 RepID=UPI0028B0B11A|nr:virulence protein [Proteiniclasticum ruminis]
MELNYNVKGDRRKQLVKGLEAILGVKSEYMGVPTFAYRIGKFMVDSAGTVTNEGTSTQVFQNVAVALSLRGFEPEGGLDQAGIGVEGEEATITDSPATSTNKVDLLEIQMPREMFTERGLENLRRLILAKGDLIKKAIGTDELPLNIEKETISFPWFPLMGDADEVEHHEKFIEALCRMAINQKRVTAKAVKSENEKYDFRCFLLRLGFIGDEHKAFRRYYLRNLLGNAVLSVWSPESGKVQNLKGKTDSWDAGSTGLSVLQIERPDLVYKVCTSLSWP